MPDEPLILVVPARPDPEREAVASAWIASGGETVFLERFWEPPALPRERVRLYGDQIFCLVVVEKLGLELVSPPDDLLAHLEPGWLNRTLSVMTLHNAKFQVFPQFVKPLTPKLFPAAVYEDAASLLIATERADPVSPVFISEAVNFLCEARCLVKRGNVIDVSIYEGAGDATAVEAFAQAFTQQTPMPITACLDVGWIDGRGWSVIEANPVWGSGLNGCDPARLADCLRLATRSG